MQYKNRLFILIILIVVSGTFASAGVTLDFFDFATTGAARAAWIPGSGMPEVNLFDGISGIEKNGLVFPCHFIEENPRCYWDRNVSLDLSGEFKFSLRLFVEDMTPLSYMTIYFKSPGGWYYQSIEGLKQGWNTYYLNRLNFGEEDAPAGWHNITGVRFSPWKATPGETNIIATEMRAFTEEISIVEGTKNADASYAKQVAELIASCFDAYSIDYNMLSDEDVENGYLSGSRLAILAYNDNMTGQELTEIENFVSAGGKIISFYTLPSQITTLLDLQYNGWQQFSLGGMQFVPGIVDCIPEYAEQASWNIHKVQPASPDSEVLAWWVDDQGNQLEHPAWIINPNGAYMSHILLSDDFEMKKRIMLALAAHFVPEIKDETVQNAYDDIGRIGPYENFEEAVTEIRSDALKTSCSGLVEDYITSATRFRKRAEKILNMGPFCDALELIELSSENLREAFYYAQNTKTPEFRAAWNHSGTGAWDGDWERSARNLAQNGFNAILPNMLWGGVAHYDSDLLPHSSTFEQYGDQIEQCVEACHKYGVEVHVWKVNWNLSRAPQDFIDDLRLQDRTQVDVNGDPVDWLCPSHPDNYELERESMLEVATKYDVDGIHFDYIRYPDQTSCYCDGCRERFERDLGVTVGTWPQDCYSGSLTSEYKTWRADQITSLVLGVSREIELRAPDVKISAAVFPNYPSCIDSIGQDWLKWGEERYLDFLCPMDYTGYDTRFRSLVENQLSLVNRHIPVYPGVGVTVYSHTPDQTITQLRIARELGCGGYVLFNYAPYLAETHLPELRKGFTAPASNFHLFLLR